MRRTNLSPLINVNEKVTKLAIVFVNQLNPFGTDFLECHDS